MKITQRADAPRYTPLSVHITLAIVLLVFPLLATLSIINYLVTRSSLIASHAMLQTQTENNVATALRFADSGYKMLERSLEYDLEKAFGPGKPALVDVHIHSGDY